MSEIEKMYKNAGIKVNCGVIVCSNSNRCDGCCYTYSYPEFTDKKQLELIKWLIANGHCYFTVSIESREFTEYLARYVNKVWQDLTEEEKVQIKEILE